MRWNDAYCLIAIVMVIGFTGTSLVYAEDSLSKASAAINNILFDVRRGRIHQLQYS